MGSVIDLTGQYFGNLEVLERDMSRTGGAAYWLCKCHLCGNTKSIRGQYLRENKPQNCGCQKQYIRKNYDMIGKEFGYLTVLERDLSKPTGRGHESYWKCQCKCGNICSVGYKNLTKGITKSCGCYRKKVIREKNTKDISGQKFGLLTAIKQTGEQSIKKDFIWECKCNCGNICYYTTTALCLGEAYSCGCQRQKSKGESKLEQIFKDNHIIFIMEKTFETCRFPKTNKLARFDFYLSNKNILIEYDGIQHFQYKTDSENTWNNKDNFEKTQYRDNYKNQWCLNNNIPLYRIPYYDIDKINTLSDILNNKYLIKGSSI